MPVNPKPFFQINGAEVPGSLAAFDGTALALRDFAIDWGTDEPLKQADPSTLTMSLLDPTGRWTTERDLPGATLELGIRWDSSSRIIWRGQITSVRMSPLDLGSEAVNRQGYQVNISAIDRLGAMGQVFTTADVPAETVASRRNRIKSMIPSGFIANIIDSASDTRQIKEVSANTSALDMVTALYSGTNPDRIFYDANTNTILGRRFQYVKFSYGAAFYKDPRTGTVRATMPQSRYQIYLHAYAKASDFEATGILTRTQGSSITQVQVSGFSTATKQQVSVAPVSMPGSGNVGSRTLAWTSDLDNLSAYVADTLKKCLEATGAAWVLDQPVLTVGAAGFEDASTAIFYLSPFQQYGNIFLSGSIHGHLAGYTPLYERVGGNIAYTAEGWKLTQAFIPLGLDSNIEPITYDAIETGPSGTPALTWGDYDEDAKWSDTAYATFPYSNHWDYNYNL